MRFYLLFITNVVALFSVNATELPQYDQQMHLGVASCAASMCHGSIITRKGSNVLQNEYIIWSREDAHSQAYQTLLTTESKNIADKLGLDNATTAELCLDCHSDNVAEKYQSKKFQISDGVGCESCHGGAEHYISSHTNSKQSHADNISKGLYPTDKPQQRAKLCLSCHQGNKEKQATHDIMGAGHPRLSFELDTFGILQPLHYVVDADYKRKKWTGDNYITWVYGQLEATRQTLNTIENKLIHSDTLFPELSLFDCYACHHPMSDLKWTEVKGKGKKPGTVRLNDGNFNMLIAIAISANSMNTLHQHVNTLRNSLHNKSQLSDAIIMLREDIKILEALITKQTLADRQSSALLILKKIINIGSHAEFSDYIAAEQAVMAIDLLIDYTGLSIDYDQAITELFNLVKNDEKYNAALFTNKLREINKRIIQ